MRVAYGRPVYALWNTVVSFLLLYNLQVLICISIASIT